MLSRHCLAANGGTRSSVGVVRSSIRILSFSTNAGSGDSLAQVRLGGRPVINSKIALSKLIISATIDEARSSASYENKADPHFQQDGIGEKAFALGSSGSSTKQTAHLSIRGARCLGKCVWKTKAHWLRIRTVCAL